VALIDPLDVITAGRSLPDGYDSWGVKSVGFDGRTKHGFEWPEPGNATAVYPLDDQDSSCPAREGDGLCVATSWRGMASGGYRAFCLLLVAYRSHEARADQPGKLRVPQVFVVARLDGERLVRADLQGANLWGADLRGAKLRGAKLRGAKLWDADLRGADLRGADLRDADLWGADLRGANLQGADLWGADLQGAKLWSADLRDAYLWDAYLDEFRKRGAIL
jgi:hypothetical protein